MKSTLKERVIEAMEGPPPVSGVELAAACKLSTASISDWRTGKTKTIEGSNLIAASKRLGVRPEWLANGIGPKFHDTKTREQPAVHQNVVAYPVSKPKEDKWITAAVVILRKLKPSQRQGAVAALRTHVKNLGPPRYGQTLPMAGKKEGAA